MIFLEDKNREEIIDENKMFIYPGFNFYDNRLNDVCFLK